MSRQIHYQCKGWRKTSSVICKRRLAVFLAAAVVMLSGVDAQAAEAIPEDLTLTFDVLRLQDPAGATDSLDIDGELFKKLAGIESKEVFTEASDPFGSMSGTLSDLGDGGGFEVINVTGENPLDVFMSNDIVATFSNSSSDPFTITYEIEWGISVDADGTKAFAETDMTLYPPWPEDIVPLGQARSDIIGGDEINYAPTDEYGSPQDISGVYVREFVVPAGAFQTDYFQAYGLFGAIDSSFTGSYYAYLTVTGVEVVPVPGAVLLGSIGLGVAGWKLRRKREV